MCVICQEVTAKSDSATLGEKGANNINFSSRERGDTISAQAGDVVHVKCRKDYIKPSSIKISKRQAGQTSSKSPKKKRLRSGSGPTFNLIKRCLFCCFKTRHAKGDADCLIVDEALRAAESSVTAVIGEDTDLLVLLLHHVKPTMRDVFLTSGSAANKNEMKLWNIQVTQERLGQDVCQHILFAHAFSGCDTTSKPFNMSKPLPLKKLESGELMEEAKLFHTRFADPDEIATAGEKVFVKLYNGKAGDSLNTLRSVRYHQKVASSNKQVEAKALPPTASASRFHSYRVYFQVQEWACLGRNFFLVPQEWGWELQQGQLFPTTTDVPPAPEDLLKVVRCNCKKDCSSGNCSCRKHGLVCTTACGECRGESCTNVAIFLEELDSE